MIKPEQIPNHVVADACDRFVISLGESHGYRYFYALRSAIAAAINAWPEAKAAWFLPQGKVYMLPAPWENPKREKNDD